MAATQHATQIKNDSQQYLTEALFQLLATKPLNAITVTALVARAGVSRMAFYRNYATLEDILRAYFAPRLQQLFDNVILRRPAPKKLADMRAFFTEFGQQLRLADKRHYEYLIRDLFTSQMSAYYAQWPDADPYWAVFMTNGVYGIWREWLLSGQQAPLAELHALIKTLQETTQAAMVKPTAD
ncbi:TetR/AcrR family transcriptional regulator [Lacticaseibacillus suihuaensis]